jgi:hypothetical protein
MGNKRSSSTVVGDEKGREIIATRIIDLARSGLIDPTALRDRVIAEALLRRGGGVAGLYCSSRRVAVALGSETARFHPCRQCDRRFAGGGARSRQRSPPSRLILRLGPCHSDGRGW